MKYSTGPSAGLRALNQFDVLENVHVRRHVLDVRQVAAAGGVSFFLARTSANGYKRCRVAYLYHIKPDGTPTEFWELGDKPLLVGRGDAVDAFVDDDSLSRHHFLVAREGADFFVIDLDSRNGITVNGERMSTHKLRPQDLIAAGGSFFCYSDVPLAIAPVLGATAAPQPVRPEQAT